MAITGKLVYKVNIGTYTGLTSDTAETVINPETREIEVNVLKLPHSVIFSQAGQQIVFDGSSEETIYIPTYALRDLGSSNNILKMFTLTLNEETQDTITIKSPVQEIVDHTAVSADDYKQLIVRDSTGIYASIFNETSQEYEFTLLSSSADIDSILTRLSALELEVAGKQDTLTFDSAPTAGSTNPVTSAGIKTAIDNAISNAYIYKGSKTVAEVNSLDTSTLKAGWIFNVSDGGIITLGNIEVLAGDNIAWTGNAWDKLAGTVVVDLSNYYTKTEVDTALSTKQATLVNQENIKSINGTSLLGSGNISIVSYHSFESSWNVTGTTAEFCTSIANDSSAVAGMTYLGKLKCSDLPAGLIQGEAVVEIISNDVNGKAIDIVLTSVDTAPYRWTYSRAKVNGIYVTTGWKAYQLQITNDNKLSSDLVDDTNHTNKFVTSSEKTTWNGKQDAINDLQTIREGAALGATALQSVPSEYITETELSNYHDSSKQDELVSGTNIKSINNNSLLGSGDLSIVEGALSKTGAELEEGNYVVGQLYYCTLSSDSFTAQNTYVATGLNTIVKLSSTVVNVDPAILTFTISPTSTEVGNAVTVAYNYTLKKYNQITNLSLDGTVIEATPSSASGSGTTSSTYDNHTFTLSGTGSSNSKTATISPIYRHFIGVMSSDVVSTILSSLKNVTSSTSTLKTYLQNSVPNLFEANVGSTATYIYFVIKGTINTIKSGGFDVPFELVQSATFTNSYDAQYSVNVYRTSNKVFGALSFNIN